MISPNIDYFGYVLVVWVRDLIVAILLEYFQHYFHKYLFKLALMNTKLEIIFSYMDIAFESESTQQIINRDSLF